VAKNQDLRFTSCGGPQQPNERATKQSELLNHRPRAITRFAPVRQLLSFRQGQQIGARAMLPVSNECRLSIADIRSWSFGAKRTRQRLIFLQSGDGALANNPKNGSPPARDHLRRFMCNGDKKQVALEACHLLCEVLPMASIEEIEKILEAALAGVPQVARVIADGPDEHREKAMAAAERSYLKTAQDLADSPVAC
jgi:hypothetical protein